MVVNEVEENIWAYHLSAAVVHGEQVVVVILHLPAFYLQFRGYEDVVVGEIETDIVPVNRIVRPVFFCHEVEVVGDEGRCAWSVHLSCKREGVVAQHARAHLFRLSRIAVDEQSYYGAVGQR